jgi:hypothetical protein
MFARIGVVATFTFAVAHFAIAGERVFTPTQGAACTKLQFQEHFSQFRCPGPLGYSVTIGDMITRIGIEFGPRGNEKALLEDDLFWAPANTGVGDRIEWRISNGSPVAAIVDTWRQPDDGGKPIEEILVAKVTQSGSCRVGTVSAHIPDAINIARTLADRLAEGFQCGIDKPVAQSNPSPNSVTESYDKLGQRETLDHNGSIMTLTRSHDDVVAIQYRSPRVELSVTPGTVLFRGQTDKTGRLTGVAYTFKPGCDPAAYPVRGEKTDGVLLLTGAAPKRDRRSCAITGYDNNSASSRLVFYHEAVSEF